MFRMVKKLGMRTLVSLMLVVGITGNIMGFDLQGGPWFYALLLGVGLTGCTFGIDKNELKGSDWRLIAMAVTIGVFVKALIIGGVMFFASGQPQFLILGIVVAQIDPLSVGALAGTSRISPKADNLLRAWSSLDDPITVLITVLVVTAQKAFGFSLGIHISNVAANSIGGYGEYLYLNIALMAVAIWLWQLAYRGSLAWKIAFTASLLVAAILAGVNWYWMFGLALMGLSIRPETKVYNWINKKLETATKLAFLAAGVIVGYLLYAHLSAHGLDAQILWGLALGAMAFVSQMIVAPLLTIGSGYTRQDRWHLALGHQNGLTAASLGLATGTIAIVVPAIIATHVLYGATNAILNRKISKR